MVVDPGVSREQGKLLVNLLSENHSRANKSGKHRIMLEGYAYRWDRIGGLDYLLRRTDIDQKDTGENRKAAEAFLRPGGFSNLTSDFLLSHPEGIERRLIDYRRRGEPLIGLIGGERLAGQRSEQSIHFTRVIAHLL